MSIDVACGCGKNLKVRDDLAGRKIKCPACEAVLTVPTPRKPVVTVVEDDEDPADEARDDRSAKKRKKKKKKEHAGMTREEFDKWSEDQAIRAFYAKRLVYIVMGLLTAVGSVVALIVFLANGMDGYIPLGASGAGILGGLYVAYQGVTGTFHER